MSEQRTGLVYGFVAYGLWGAFPLFWPLLKPAGAVEILAHRMVWTLLVMGLILLVLRRWAWLGELVRQPKRLALVAAAAAAVSANWGMYIWSVNSGHVVEASLGYFINPLVTIALGVLILHERLRPVQWAAVGVGVLAVVVLTVGYGRLPWIALTLAFSFGLYGLVKKKLGMGGFESVAAESMVQFLPAFGFLMVLGARGDSTFTHHGPGHAALLASCGLVTAVPLICFGMAANRLPLTTIGLMQYLTPVLQFLSGLLYFHEEMPPERWAGFALVWVALAVLVQDALRGARRGQLAARTVAAAGPGVAGTAAAGAPEPAGEPCGPAAVLATEERPEAAAGR